MNTKNTHKSIVDKERHLPFQWTNGAAPVKPSATAAAPHLLTRTKMINLKCLLLWLAVHLLVLSLHSFFFPSKTPFYPDSSLTNSPSELSERLLFQSLVLVTQFYWLFVSPGTVAHQAPLSMEFSRQEY